MILNRDNILGALTYEVHKVEVPKWGGTVCVRSFSARLKDKIEQMQLEGAKKQSIRAVSLAGCICNEKGELLFSDSDIEALADKDVESVDLVLDKILEINSITDEGIKEASKN